ncbi:MAG: diguanylate cyclase [Clostridiales bacterium]|jgi:diguanylate cyclase (GGDEF)-like protein|nr:diguanylate cyclase [Clostridiales bacterium]
MCSHFINDVDLRPSILVVDDDRSTLLSLNSILSEAGYVVYLARTAKYGLTLAEENLPTLILLDLIMPEINGFEFLQRLRRSEDTREIPVIFLTAIDNVKTEEIGLHSGAVDYILKPPVRDTLLARIATTIRSYANMRDKILECYIDPLTRLYNRRFLERKLDIEWRRATRDKKENHIAYILCDLDNFRSYNDRFGHSGGDVILKNVGKVLADIAHSENGFAVRIGGEEFVLLIPNAEQPHASQIAENVRKSIEMIKIPELGNIGSVTMSFGAVSFIPNNKTSIKEVVIIADKYLYQAKNSGKNKVVDATSTL